MADQSWMEDVTIDMLPKAHRKLAEIIGVEATLKICAHYGGDRPYIPSTKGVYISIRNKSIRQEYGCGIPVHVLAKRYDMTPRAVQQIVDGVREQINIFDSE